MKPQRLSLSLPIIRVRQYFLDTVLEYKKTFSKAASMLAFEPVTLAGSGMLQCNLVELPGIMDSFRSQLIADRDHQLEGLFSNLIP
jgi:hypothetical protein